MKIKEALFTIENFVLHSKNKRLSVAVGAILKSLVEGQNTSTGSPKLPTVKNLESHYDAHSLKTTGHRATESELDIVRFCHKTICRQLRAGA